MRVIEGGHTPKAPTNIGPLRGHSFVRNVFRSRSPRREGAPVLIGRIPDRYEIFLAIKDLPDEI